jgi:hypothetical protein
MAPKIWKGIKGKSSVLKKPAAGNAPSAIRGLAGFRKASAIFTGAVDKGVSQQNAPLASRASVLEGLDARLVCIDPAMNSDKYYVLQGLVDTKIPEGKPKRCYAYQRWGRTGTGGVCRLQGPMEQKKVEAHLRKVFMAKTGTPWVPSLKAGEKAKPGKYWLVVPSEADPHATWEYYVDDGVDHKRNGWYPYDSDAVQQVEELHAEHSANKSSKNSTAKRFVASGKFTYLLDLDKLLQRNSTTGKERKIRRTVSSRTPRPDTPIRSGSSPSLASPGLFRADTADTVLATWSDAEWNAKAAKLGVSRVASSVSSLPGLPGKRARRDAATALASISDMRKLVQHGDLERLPQSQLKSWLSSRGVATTGRKCDLVDRVHDVLDNV